MGDLPIRCSCGAVEGVLRAVSQRRANRGRCYCDDCQSFAHFLGRADEILDAHGGTVVLQISPKRFEIHQGREQVACMQLRPKGLLRWYTKCCGTPLGNTSRMRWVPFVGVIENCLRAATYGRQIEEVAGPVRAEVFQQYARGDRSELPRGGGGPLTMVLRMTRIVGAALIRREHRQSPFFNQSTGAPSVTPHVLAAEQLREVEAVRDAWAP
jgi:hypothetical protein